MKNLSLFLIMTLLLVVMGFLPEETGPGTEIRSDNWMEPQTIYVKVD